MLQAYNNAQEGWWSLKVIGHQTFSMGDKIDILGVVESIEYDANKSANIALPKYSDGETLE
jgi:ribosomal protein L2